MARVEMRYCAWCRAEIGESDFSEPDHCGERECAREVVNLYLQEREEAQYAAERDDYERYR